MTSADRVRAAEIDRFLAAAGWGVAERAPIAGDASNRRYVRLTGGKRHAILMDAPPDHGEDVRPFVEVTHLLRRRHLSAPEIFAADPDAGLLLLEDLGDALFARVCAADPGAETRLYAEAVDLLAGYAAPAPHLPAYDGVVLEREALLALDWYLAGLAGPASSDLVADYNGQLRDALADVASDASVLVLRDYHAENLIWLPERAGPACVGLLDYQDALAGHPAYDLVSLLEDARRDTDADLRAAMIARYLNRRPDLEPEAFRAAYAALGAQRNLKIIGIFARLCLRDGKPRYLGLIPRVWAHLMRDLDHPGLAALRTVVLAALPGPEPAALDCLAAASGSRSA